jgi:DDE family transposase
MDTFLGCGYLARHGYHFANLDRRHQSRFRDLVRQHSHAVNAAVSGLSALPGTRRSFAASRAMTRFLNHEDISFTALIEPAQDAIRDALAASPSSFALVVHDWCMFSFQTHDSKLDRYQRSHDRDLGYELGSALVIDAADGRPLGPMELRLRTAEGMLSTRPGDTALPPGHVDELLDVMTALQATQPDKTLVHIVDREADSIGHYRQWHTRGHRFLVRADLKRRLLWQERERPLTEVVAAMALDFQDVPDGDGPIIVTIHAGVGRVRVAETNVVLHRPARQTVPGKRTARGHRKQIDVPGVPLPLRLIVTRVVNAVGKVLAEWCLLTNLSSKEANASTVGRWYAWRWRIETYHKLLKSAGLNAEEWQQESGPAFLRRLCVASMACLSVWHLQRDESAEAARLRSVLVRLSGRQMKHRVESTAPALLAGLEKLLAFDDLMQNEDIQEILALARRVLPKLFHSG